MSKLKRVSSILFFILSFFIYQSWIQAQGFEQNRQVEEIDADAQYKSGLYYSGIYADGKENAALAAGLFRTAAKQGHADTQ